MSSIQTLCKYISKNQMHKGRTIPEEMSPTVEGRPEDPATASDGCHQTRMLGCQLVNKDGKYNGPAWKPWEQLPPLLLLSSWEKIQTS